MIFYLFMRGEDGEARSCRLVLIGSAQSPERDGSASILGEPTLELGLSGVMWQTIHMQYFAAFGEEGSDIGSGVHRPTQDLRMFVLGLRLSDQTTQNTGECDGLLHGSTRRSWCEGLQVKGQIVLDRCRGLHRFHLKSGTNVGQRARPERQRFGMMLLPFGVFCAQVVCSGVLQIGRQDHSLVAGLSRQLNTEIPRVERDKGEFQVFRDQVFVGEIVKPGNCISEGTCIANVFPREGCQTRYMPCQKPSERTDSWIPVATYCTAA